MRVKNLKKKKKTLASGLKRMSSRNQNNSKPQWEKVKLSGKLLSMDDGDASLEGLLGLEVLENYDGAISITKGKPVKGKNKKILSSIKKDNVDDIDMDQSQSKKNERKRKQKQKEFKKKKNLTEDIAITHHNPGKYVRLIPDCDDSSYNDNTIEKIDKLKNSNHQTTYRDESNKIALSTEDLIVSEHSFPL